MPGFNANSNDVEKTVEYHEEEDVQESWIIAFWHLICFEHSKGGFMI